MFVQRKFVQRKFCIAKIPDGEKSVRQKIRTAKNPTAKIPTAKNLCVILVYVYDVSELKTRSVFTVEAIALKYIIYKIK